MSEKILKALMQLFAIIARPEASSEEQSSVVESFLKQQLNKELVQEYIKVFNDYYDIHQQRFSEKDKIKKRFASSSVRVLKICTQINQELTQKQKIIVLIQLLEFIKSDDEITDQGLEFVATVADTFHISPIEYENIKSFVFNPFELPPDLLKVLIIDSNEPGTYSDDIKHITALSLEGQIRVLNITTVNLFAVQYIGEDEVYINGQLLQPERIRILNVGSSVKNPKIQPIYYSDIVSAFIIDKIHSKIIFDAQEIEYRFKNGTIGLHKMNFTDESGKLVGIMGASGTGKTTLLNLLNGTYTPTSGEVLINGINIHTEKDKIDGFIGYVAQDDLLIEELTVFQNLYFNTKLCFDNYSEFQVLRTVLRLLQTLGLYEIKDMKVGSPLNKRISGGQRKRLNIALELIREPAVLFLDEPTSGLSSRDSENILDLLKELALKGKLVIVVIHQPSSDIFKMFDKLMIFDNGGYLIYNGDPVDSITYFKSRTQLANWSEAECHSCGNVNPEQIFNIIEAQVIDEYGNLTHVRKTSPNEWNEMFKVFSQQEASVPINTNDDLAFPDNSFKIPNRIKQFSVFLKRDVLSKLSDFQYLVINLVEAPLLAFVLSFIIKYYSIGNSESSGYSFFDNSNIPVYIFMSVIVALFIGLTVSAEEIIKDAKIRQREAFLNLSRASYLVSKIAILFILSAFQAFSFVIVGNLVMEIKGMFFHYWIVLFAAWCLANILGLNISDSFKTSVTIYILIPFLIIPQIILSGVMVSYEKLNPQISTPNSIPVFGELITARWAFEALAVHQFKANKYNRNFYEFDKKKSVAGYKKNYWIPELIKALKNIERNISTTQNRNEIDLDLNLLKYELSREPVKSNDKLVSYESISNLTINKIDQTVIERLDLYLEKLRDYYIASYNDATKQKDDAIIALQTKLGKEAFHDLMIKHHNDKLEEFVTNSQEFERIIRYKDRLYQRVELVYKYPERNLKAHFYAPKKKLFGMYFDTFWINVLVIWFSTLTLYISLYYRLLRRFLAFMEEKTARFFKET